MDYSVIIPYRDRETHLSILLPRLIEGFEEDAEIIVVEQDDNETFLRGVMRNVGAKHATAKNLVFNDVDHYPAEVDYFRPIGYDVYLPIRRVIYVDNDLQRKPTDKVPAGYRHFEYGVDQDFFGGCVVFRKQAFFNVNGYNSEYRGWGLEDSDLLNRCHHYKLNMIRGDGLFYALDHEDSNPGVNDADYKRNAKMFAQGYSFLTYGVNHQHDHSYEVEPPEQYRNIMRSQDKWIKARKTVALREAFERDIAV